MLDTIIFPTDFSSNADHAMQSAADMAWRSQGTLVLTYVCEPLYDFATRKEKLKSEQYQQAQNDLDKMAESIKETPGMANMDIITDLREGTPVWGILEAANEFNADAIVMATKGVKGLKHMLFADVTTRIITESDIPVFTVPENAQTSGFKEIVFPTDYNDDDLNMLAPLISFADNYNAQITVLHIGNRESLKDEIMFRGFRELIAENVKYPNIGHKMLYSEDSFDEINNYMSSRQHSILAIADYRKTFLEKLTSTNFNLSNWPELLNSLPLIIVKT